MVVVSRPVVMKSAVVAVAWRPISAVPVGTIVIVDVVVIVRVGIIGCRGICYRRHVGRFCDVCCCWRDVGRRTVVCRCFVCDASRAVDAKRRYRKKHFSRVVHGAPAFLFTRCEGISLPISDRK